MKAVIYKQAKASQVDLLCEVEEKAWASPGENISANREKLLARIPKAGETLSTVLATVNNQAAGSQYAFRFNWDGDIEKLGSWDDHTAEGWIRKKHEHNGNTGFLVGVGVVPEFRGIKVEHDLRWPEKFKISELLIAATLDNLFKKESIGGVKKVIANARVPFYYKHPALSIEEYCSLTRADGKLYDPVLRFHKRMGAKIIRPIAFSMEDAESLNAGCWVEYARAFEV